MKGMRSIIILGNCIVRSCTRGRWGAESRLLERMEEGLSVNWKGGNRVLEESVVSVSLRHFLFCSVSL